MPGAGAGLKPAFPRQRGVGCTWGSVHLKEPRKRQAARQLLRLRSLTGELSGPGRDGIVPADRQALRSGDGAVSGDGKVLLIHVSGYVD